jgi:hypothetical protein
MRQHIVDTPVVCLAVSERLAPTTSIGRSRCPLLLGLIVLMAPPMAAHAQTALSGGRLTIERVSGSIQIDGDLSDEGWRNASPIDRWYETNPGDNVDPKVRSTGYLAYDERFLYAAFDFEDPDPGAIRAPYADHDNISGNFTDYGGLLLDTRNDGHSAVLLLATPRGVQYDAQTDDASGEDASPDFFWDSKARMHDRGWTLEIRVPFSSLRYRSADPQTWGIMLYRNYPRDFRYQIFSTPLPRGSNCFICRANTLVGLEQLPSGGHVVVAPYVSGSQVAKPENGLGSRLRRGALDPRGGVDVKWTPNADNVIDFTIMPDFSQIESDTAQISTNERFALLFSEKRPFFLEGVNLLRTRIQAVYTRTITDPRWGSRITGKSHGVSYTALVSEDNGGGSVVLPGPNGSSLANQDFGSYVAVARARGEVGRSFLGLVATDRESHDGYGYSRLVGPDLQWRWKNEVVTGQWLFSSTRTPARPDLSAQWAGSVVAGHAVDIDWTRNTRHFDSNVGYKTYGEGFRADVGFVPQVGYQENYVNAAWTVRPNGIVRNVRTSVNTRYQRDQHGELVSEYVTPSVSMDAKYSGYLQFRLINDRTRAGEHAFTRRQFGYVVRFSPTPRIAQVAVDGVMGQEIDFSNSRLGRGSTINMNARFYVNDHLDLLVLQNQRRLHVDDAVGVRRSLFLSRVSRVRGTYMFTSTLFARLIAQYVSISREPGLYLSPVSRRSGTFSTSALLAYKINWQSVLFIGYGDDRELSIQENFERSGQQFFVKMSYAFQR